MPLDRHISVFAEPAFEPRNVLFLAVTRDIRHPTMVTMQDDEVQTTTTPLSPKISPADKLAPGLGLPDDDGVRSPNSRMSTLSV